MKIYITNKKYTNLLVDRFPGIVIVQHPRDADIIICVGSEDEVLRELKKLAPGFLQEYVMEDEDE